MKLPHPDITFYMDIDADVAIKLIEERCRAQSVPADIHERNRTYLRRCARAGKYGAKICHWTKIRCTNKDSDMDPIITISDRIWEAIPEEIKTKWGVE